LNARRLIFSLYVVLFAGLGTAGCFLLEDAREEYNRLVLKEDENRRRLAEAEARLKQEEKILDRMRTDPAFVEKMIRQKLGYAKPDEFIFRFENQ
jgi:cell division protein DivIC